VSSLLLHLLAQPKNAATKGCSTVNSTLCQSAIYLIHASLAVGVVDDGETVQLDSSALQISVHVTTTEQLSCLDVKVVHFTDAAASVHHAICINQHVADHVVGLLLLASLH